MIRSPTEQADHAYFFSAISQSKSSQFQVSVSSCFAKEGRKPSHRAQLTIWN